MLAHEIEATAGKGGLALGALLLAAVAIRLIGLDQPIVENYVGRQVPTAMVARNLARGGDWLRPRLDVAPIPNLFLVEPPIFAALAAVLNRGCGLPLEAAGRLVSALGVALGGWGLFGLTARREGARAGLAVVAVFIALPVTLRYGRAFQPDALMLGCVLAGMNGWDRYESERSLPALVLGVFLLATGLAMKVISAFVLWPLIAIVIRERRPRMIGLAVATLLPAALWYTHAAALIAAGEGSRASADNGEIWLGVLYPRALSNT